MALTSRTVATMFTTFAVLSTLTLSGTQAYADDGNPSAPPGSLTTSPPPTVDPTSPGLKLADGATLAPAKVLDIKSVVEDLGGEERREDTNSDVTFALQAEVLFPKDSSKLNPDARSRIQAIADEIKNQKATTVRVFGFTTTSARTPTAWSSPRSARRSSTTNWRRRSARRTSPSRYAATARTTRSRTTPRRRAAGRTAGWR